MIARLTRCHVIYGGTSMPRITPMITKPNGSPRRIAKLRKLCARPVARRKRKYRLSTKKNNSSCAKSILKRYKYNWALARYKYLTASNNIMEVRKRRIAKKWRILIHDFLISNIRENTREKYVSHTRKVSLNISRRNRLLKLWIRIFSFCIKRSASDKLHIDSTIRRALLLL